MDEFDLIDKYFSPLAGAEGLNLKDDTAVFQPNPGREMLVTTDSFVEGVHFPEGMYGANVAKRLLRTNLSDIAAKGGRPLGYQLSVSMRPDTMKQWVPAFAKGLETTQSEYDCALWGGDMTATAGPAVFSITLLGDVANGDMVQRKGATDGDDIWVSGVLGDAMLGCRLATEVPIIPAPNANALFAFEAAYWRPEPGFKFETILHRFATSAADISDGVLADIGHITRLNGVGARLNFEALPFSLEAQVWADGQEDLNAAKIELASFGDDYGLVFTAAKENRQAIFDLARQSKLNLTLAGSIFAGEGVSCVDVDGVEMTWSKPGYLHI